MFHNKLVGNDKLHDKIFWLGVTAPNYVNRIYNIIISNIETSKQYDRYYILNSDMLFFDYDQNVVIERTYLNLMEENINNVINDDNVIADIRSGNALLIFDFGSEIVPLSTDQTTMYGIINDHFQKIDCTDNVVYWTMYETPYDLVNKDECSVDIVSSSLSTLRYIGFNYDNYKEITHNNDILSKSAIYLNRRIRPHRTKLLIECLRREVNIDDMYFSYIGSDELIGENGVDVSYNLDMIDLVQAKVDKNQISRSNFERVVGELYGKRIAMEDKEIIKWLGSSNIERVIELLNHRAKSKFEIITEYSCTDTDIQISEKLSLSMLSKIPFVVIGDKGYMNHLKKLGFKTFNKFWSEEYDRCNGDERIKSLTSTIIDIQQNFKCDLDEYGNFVYSDEMNEILEYNYIHYKDVYAQTLYNRILKSVSKNDTIDIRHNVKDKIWYNKDNELRSLFVPIPGNRYEYFEDEIASELGYELVNRSDVDNLTTLKAYVAIRNPVSRIEEQLYSTSLTLDGFLKQHNNTDRGIEQHKFIEGLNIQGIVDLDNLVGRSDSPRNFVEHLSQEFWRIVNNSTYDAGKFSDNDLAIITKTFESDFSFYNKYKLLGEKMKYQMWQFSEHYDGPTIRDETNIHFDNFSENYPTIIEASNNIKKHNASFKEKLSAVFWRNYGVIFDKIGIQNAPKDISILDMGTQLGFIPHFLKEQGFTNVECTNSSVEASEHLHELETVWKEMELSPLDLHISPEKEFTLHKKYDIILCTQTNVLWNTNRLLKIHNSQMYRDYHVVDKNNKSHTFFVPYNTDELKFFINNIKKYLKEDGIAVIQPFPFPYYTEGFEKELELLKTYQVKGHWDTTKEDRLLHDYFVITN